MRLWISRWLPPLICLVVAATLGIIFALRLNAVPAVLQTTAADTQIFLSANRSTVFFPGDCVQLTWDIVNTQRVIVNDALLPAAGEQQFCPTADRMPRFNIMLMDSSEQDYTLPIEILALQPLTWAWIIGAAIFGLVGVVWLISLFAVNQGKQLARIAFASLFGLLVALGILEIALRVYFNTAGTTEQKIMYTLSLEEVRARQVNIVHLPYVSYVPAPDYAGHNALGYRGAEIDIPKPAGIFRILALGGSTTYSTSTDAEHAYPALLQTILRDEYGYTNIEVINGGGSGYTTWEIVANFQFRGLELEPDLILYYEAVNDLVVRERSSIDCYRGLNPLRGINALRGLFVERAAPFPPSTLYRVLAVSFGWMPNPLALDSSFEPVRVDCTPDAPNITLEDRLKANAPIYYERNIRNLILLAQGNGIQPVLSSWVYHINAGRPDLWQQGIADHNAITRRLADEWAVPYMDLAATFPVDASFWDVDGFHMLPPGTQEQARQFAAFLVENELLP
jgi:hypothetical protein